MYRKPYLSYTKIKTYLTCKQKYKFKYLDKIPTSEDSNSKHLSFGTSIHMALADYNRIKDEEFKTLPILQNLLRKNWKREGYQSREEEREFGLRGLALLEDYCGEPKDEGVDNYIIEEMVYLELEDYILCGKLDKVYKRPDDIVEILDYKTSKSMENVEFLQLPIYLILAKSKLGFYPEALSLYYLTFNEKVIKEIDPESFEKAKTTLFKICQEMIQEQSFDAKPCGYCKDDCGYFHICDAAKNHDVLSHSYLTSLKSDADFKTVF